MSESHHQLRAEGEHIRDIERAEDRGRMLEVLERLTAITTKHERRHDEHDEKFDVYGNRLTAMETKWLIISAAIVLLGGIIGASVWAMLTGNMGGG